MSVLEITDQGQTVIWGPHDRRSGSQRRGSMDRTNLYKEKGVSVSVLEMTGQGQAGAEHCQCPEVHERQAQT